MGQVPSNARLMKLIATPQGSRSERARGSPPPSVQVRALGLRVEFFEGKIPGGEMVRATRGGRSPISADGLWGEEAEFTSADEGGGAAPLINRAGYSSRRRRPSRSRRHRFALRVGYTRSRPFRGV